jgi:hypothetical protein
MNIQSILNGLHDCPCGKDHPCDIRYVELGQGILDKLGEICAPFSRILLVSDSNTYPLCGEKVKKILGDKITSEVRFGKETVVPNEAAIAEIDLNAPKYIYWLSVGGSDSNPRTVYNNEFRDDMYGDILSDYLI